MPDFNEPVDLFPPDRGQEVDPIGRIWISVETLVSDAPRHIGVFNATVPGARTLRGTTRWDNRVRAGRRIRRLGETRYYELQEVEEIGRKRFLNFTAASGGA